MSENWVTFIRPGEQALAFRAYAVRVLEVLERVRESGACPGCGAYFGPHALDCEFDALIRETEEMLK